MSERRPFYSVLCGRATIAIDTIRLSGGELMGSIAISPRGETLIGAGSLSPLIRALRRLQLQIENDSIERSRTASDEDDEPKPKGATR
jgi:hypothetical protein